jgi:tRNA (guanine-N7-)-methyltransferase
MTFTQIRTFKPRRGRLGTQRREALHRLWPVYGVEITGGPLDPTEWSGRTAPLVLEIGSGMGDATAEQAAADPARDYLAVEVHTPGVAHLLSLIEAGGLPNLRVAHGDALELLRGRLAPESLAAIHAFFPDPWPKSRHHKRRLFQPAHVALLRSRLARGGTLHTVTDWADYAQAMRESLTADPELVNAYPAADGWAPRSPHRPQTRYERRAQAAGRQVFELVFHRR